MTTYDSTHRGTSPLSWRTLVAHVRDWNDARRTRKALSKLTIRELDDIGLVPGDIDRF